jgi:G:T-mismatch repair DNA endonuclease (very short patch repair protein)
MKKYYCIDCGKEVSRKTITRCRICSNKGKNHPSWNGGLPHCIECNKLLAHYKSLRCKKCANKGKLNPRFGIKEDIIKKNIRIKNLLTLIHCSPNKLEINVNKLLNSLLPNQYKFVGNGTIILEGFNPDFINIEEKKIIEVYGNYWHTLPGYKERDERRLQTYTKYGYKTLIIWEHELKNIDILTNKIINFC